MYNDIVPELLDEIQFKFNDRFSKSKKIASLQKKIDKGTATYLDAQAYSIEVGEILAKVFKESITTDVLPDGRMYFNIAERILSSTLGNNHKLISTATLQIQELLNANAGLGLKAVEVPIYKNKVDSLVNKLSTGEDFESVSWILDEPIVTFSQNIVDEIIKANVDFHAQSGLDPIIVRTVHGHDPCDWCLKLAGTYDYAEVKNTGNDVYRRHDRCKCTVEYVPRKSKSQDVWSKTWRNTEEKEKIEMRKTYGL